MVKVITLSKNKTIEIETYKDKTVRFEISIRWITKTDHAGLDINIGLFGNTFRINTYDNRHWDYDKEKWEL